MSDDLRVRIVSDGMSPTTHIICGDVELPNVSKVVWTLDAEKHVATVDLTLTNVPVEVEGIMPLQAFLDEEIANARGLKRRGSTEDERRGYSMERAFQAVRRRFIGTELPK